MHHSSSPLFLVGLASLSPLASASAADHRPNIIYIMCDDLGYGDLACYGQKNINTPHIDRLAAEGVRFTQAYAGSPVSAPSRASLMTGQHTGHTEVRGNKEYWPEADTVWYGNNADYALVGQHPYDPRHIILPELMKKLGYTTGMFGKWAGGYEGSPSTPDKRGVDEFFGYICQFQAHLYYPNFLNRYRPSLGDTATVRVVLDENIGHPMFGPGYKQRTQYSADLIHWAALDWIGRQDGNKPFMGILTYTLPHAELTQPDDSLVAKYHRRFFHDKTWGGWEPSRYNAADHTHAQFAAMVERLDQYVGEIMNLLKEKGLDENTLVIFTSDNGPHEEGGADPKFFGHDGPLRGLKRECLEGGIRIPFIARWPAQIAAGRESDHQLAFYDVMPTLAEMAGQKNVARRFANKQLQREGREHFDGISFLPTLQGDTLRQQHHDYLYWEFHETDQIAVRRGDWKLFVSHGTPHLYNLASDIRERSDVAKAHPDIVSELIDIVYREHQESPLFRVTMPERPTQSQIGKAVADLSEHFVVDQTLFRSRPNDKLYYRIPAIITAPDGSLVAVADRRWGHDGDLGRHRIDVVCRRSTDGGRTWSQEQTIAAGDGQTAESYGFGDPALVTTRSGKLLCLMAAGANSFYQGIRHIYMAESTDNGKTWTQPQPITTAQRFTDHVMDTQGVGIHSLFTTSGQGLLMQSGRVAFVAVAIKGAKDNAENYMLYSDDEGQHWHLGPAPMFAIPKKSANEAKVIQRPDGSLLASIRQHHARAFNISRDEGKTWETARRDTTVRGNSCNSEMLALPDGRILHTMLMGEDRREDLRLLVSDDQGSSWHDVGTIQPGQAAYSTITLLPNGDLALFFEDGANTTRAYDLRFVIIPAKALAFNAPNSL